jgi:hypothetical protein
LPFGLLYAFRARSLPLRKGLSQFEETPVKFTKTLFLAAAVATLSTSIPARTNALIVADVPNPPPPAKVALDVPNPPPPAKVALDVPNPPPPAKVALDVPNPPPPAKVALDVPNPPPPAKAAVA